MAGLLRKLVTQPHYALGRFRGVRAVYSGLQATLQALAPASGDSIRMMQHKRTLAMAPVQASGLVESAASVEAHVQNLRLRSFSGGLTLTEAAQQQLLAIAKNTPLVGAHGRVNVAYADLESSPQVRAALPILTIPLSGQLPIVQALAADPLLTGPVTAYLGYKPLSAGSWFFWSLRNDLSLGERERMNQTVRYHYDVDGMNFVYVNFYLTDTTRESGAHMLIEGTHKRKSLKQLLGSARIDDIDAHRAFGEERERIIEGAAGDGFFEDTSCYHKAIPPRSSDRLILQLRYR
jgi:hypothetical protein